MRILFGLILLGIFLLFGLSSLRRQFVIRPLLAYLKTLLPVVSETEKIVLEAGDMWWEKDLFRGKPDWQTLQAITLSQLTSEEQTFISNQVKILCEQLDDFKIVSQYHDLPESVWKYLRQERFFGMVIPKRYGGLGFSAMAHSTIILKIATRSVSAAVDALVPNSLGPAELLLHYGTETQKDYYLPRLARGEEIPCFALTSIDAGSDAAAIKDRGVIAKGDYQGQNILGIRLNFSKRYITLAPIATVIGVAFRVEDPDHLMGQKTELGITVALIPATLPGITIGKRHSPMGLAFMNGPVEGKEAFIPIHFVIGGEDKLGQGWRMLMECLAIGRGISLPAVSAAQAQLAYRMTGAYGLLREQFGLAIAQFEGVSAALAKIAGLTYLVEATRRFTVTAVDRSLKPALAASIAKYHMTEFARLIINHAMDVHGGRGIQLGPRNYLAQGYIAIPISITVEGANILTRNLILFGQGAVRCHPFLMEEMQAIVKKDVVGLDNLLLKHVFYWMRNLGRTIGFSLGFGRFLVKVPLEDLAYYYRQLSRLSATLALVTDLTLFILGGDLKRKERLSARLGDVLSYLYMASCVLRYYQDYRFSKEDGYYIRWALDYCLYRIQQAFVGFFTNFPNRFLANILKWIAFPLGQSYSLPTDKQDRELVAVMIKNSAFRDRMTQDCYLGESQDDTTGRMEFAFKEWIKCEVLRKKLRKLRKERFHRGLDSRQQLEEALKQGFLTSAEVEQFLFAKKLQQDSLQVDVF